MSTLTLTPEGTFVSGDSDPHTHVPVDRMTEHPLLRLARIDDDRLTWPGLEVFQRRAVKDVYHDDGHVVLPSRINFDLVVDESTGGFERVATLDDIQRFYTRFTTTMLLHIGTFTALTRDGVRRYFLWRSGEWSELGLNMYLHYRDGDFQFFTETNVADNEQLDPGAVGTEPLPMTSDIIKEGEWHMNESLSKSATRSRMYDRAIGAVLASAAGDALGSQYEFGPALADDHVVEFGVGYFGHARGEWTDDTSMAMPILQALAHGDSLNDDATLERIVTEWREWSRTSPDVGAQTSSVLGALGGDFTEKNARAASQSHHERTGRSGGNGSLMRTGTVALGYLEDGREADLVDAARRIAQLTHWEDDNVDACVLWCLAIRHAIRTGELDIRGQLPWVPAERRERWAAFIDEALAPGAHPRDFRQQNGWVVRALQGALAAISGAKTSAGHTQAMDALERAVRGGHDTDTVAAIAGSLAGALWGATQIPLSWRRILHGWPSLRAHDLTNLAFLAARGGKTTRDGWPTVPAMPSREFRHTAPLRHPHDDGVWLGSLSALGELPAKVNAVVSLSRVGAEQVAAGVESIRVWLIDEPGHDANLDFVLADAADTIAALRAEGKQVVVHCAEARSRTATVAALYAIRHCGIAEDQAWKDVAGALPNFAPAPFHRDAVARICAQNVI